MTCSKRPMVISLGSIKSGNVEAKDLKIVIGDVVYEEEWEPMGPAPCPPYIALRPWDYFLFKRYTPTYVVKDRDAHVKTLFNMTIAGTSHYIAVARMRLDYAYSKLGEDAEIKLGLDIEAPLTRTIIGVKPVVLRDLEKTLEYVTREFSEIIASAHSNNESYYLDYESKMFHLGLLSLLAMEVAELPYMLLASKKGVPEKLEWGPGTIDETKPFVFVIGDTPFVVDIVESLESKNMANVIEVGLGGCYALDLWRITGGKAKIVALQSEIKDIIESGVVDVIVVGENGAIPNILDLAKKTGTKVLITTPRSCLGLPDLTSKNADEITEFLSRDDVVGALITDPKKLAEVAISLSMKLSAKRELKKKAKIPKNIWKAKPPLGAFPEEVVRSVGVPVVMGTMPGVVAVVGCSFYPKGVEELGIIVEKLARRNYLILTTECTALALSRYITSETNESLYEAFPDNIIIMGSPTSVAHIAGLAVKIPAIFAKIPLRGNGPVILDYLLNRVPAVGLAWSTPNEATAAMAWGVLRAGVPVVVGPALAVAGRLFLGNPSDKERYMVFDNRTKKKVFAGPIPEHLLYLAKDPGEALIMISKLVIRLNDGNQCRSIKVSHYIDFYEEIHKTLPPDLDLYIRCEADIPLTRRKQVQEYLEKKGWEPMEPSLIDPTILPILLGQVLTSTIDFITNT